MDAALWQRVETVFADTIELPVHARDSYLEQECAGHPQLRAEVESLLDAHRRAGAFIEPIPDRVGPYRLLEEIGHGGMGAVYRASRDDGQFEHQVAVKLLSLAASPSLYRRFLDEQQILANLSHPHIARLLDGGITRAGISYIVMEFIDGEPIDRYCRGRSESDRVQLFRTVCGAVHYAHQNLVVHRDLKPANIIVTRDGAPKLLDFGVAKMLAAESRSSGATIVPALTPEYASPEQLCGGPISTASDVYSLGVILYELLTNRRPYQLAAKTYDEIRRTVCDDPIEKPATGSPDLDAIVAKAMRKAPADRYSSAEALSADVDRYLSKHPVDARRGATWYVLSKFLARHRVAMATAGAVALVVAAAVTMTVRQSRLAQRRFQDVRQMASSIVFDIHDAVAKLPGSTPARKLIVTRAVTHLDRLAADAAGDPDLQLELGEAYLRLGDVQGFQSQANLGDAEGAIASYTKAHALLAAIRGGGPRGERATFTLGEVCRHHAAVLMFVRRTEEAQRLAEEDVSLLEGLVARRPTDVNRRALASAYNSLADAAERTDYGLKAVAIAEDLLAKAPDDASRRRDVALMHKYLAAPLLDPAKGERGLAHLRRAEELDAASVATDPGNRQAQLDLSFDYSQNGTFYSNRKQYEPALFNFQKALDIRRRLAEADPTDVRLRDRLVYTCLRAGDMLMSLNRNGEAHVMYAHAKLVSDTLVATDPKQPQFQLNLAGSQQGLGNTHAALGRTSQACSAWRAAAKIYASLDEEKKLRPYEQNALAELKTQIAGCRE